jgi:hypothetical protein
MHGHTHAQWRVVTDYDTTKTVLLTGSMMASIAPLGGVPVCLLIDVKNSDHTSTKWIIAGKDLVALRREGWRFGPSGILKGGDILKVRAYLPRTASRAAEKLATAMMAVAPPNFPPPLLFVDELRKKDVHLAYGLEISLPDGTTLVFGDRN